MPVTKLSRVQERGQVTIPQEVREQAGLKKGDLVRFEVTKWGILISPQEVVAADAMNRLGEILKARGLTLEELIESGRDIRGALIKEEYGLDDETQ